MSFALNSETLALITVFATGSTASLASGSNALSAVQDPTTTAYGGTGSGGTPANRPGYRRGRFTFVGTFAAAPALNGSIQLFARLPADGTLAGTPTTYETDLGRSTNPISHRIGVIGLDTTNTSQSRTTEEVDIPNVPFQVIAVNLATGQTISSGWYCFFVPSADLGA